MAELEAPTLVFEGRCPDCGELVRYEDGARRDWRVLDEAWDLVGDREEFQAYVTRAARAFTRMAAISRCKATRAGRRTPRRDAHRRGDSRDPRTARARRSVPDRFRPPRDPNFPDIGADEFNVIPDVPTLISIDNDDNDNP